MQLLTDILVAIRLWYKRRQYARDGYSVHVGMIYPSQDVYGNWIKRQVYLPTRNCKYVTGYHYSTQSYWCAYCFENLHEGPSAGHSVNMICTKCGINFGCLPGGYGENVPRDRRKLSNEEVRIILGDEAAFEQVLAGVKIE